MLVFLRNTILVAGMLTTGTINTIVKKVQNGITAPGYYNDSANGTKTEHIFNKPWFQTYLMFLGEILCLFGYLVYRVIEKKKYRTVDGEFRTDDWNETVFSQRLFSWIFILPAVLDIAATTLQGFGLLYIDASVWQMLRGSIIVFAGLLSMLFLKRRLVCYQWTGMMVTVIGLCLVGLSSVFKTSDDSMVGADANTIIGLFLVLAGSLATATQMIVEEIFLKRRHYHPLHVVGMEGFYGFVIMSFIILPIIHNVPGPDLNNTFENILDALFQIGQDAVLLSTAIFYILSITFFNYFSLAVTNYLSAVHRSLLDALRSIFVWVCSIILFYAAGDNFGEPFDVQWGVVQIDGFILLVIGTFVFNKTISLSFMPCCRVKEIPPNEDDNETSVSLSDDEDKMKGRLSPANSIKT